jgi:hypothetical protein
MTLLIGAAIAMSLAQLFDLTTFAEMVRALGPTAEQNPVVGLILGLYGLPMVAIAKIALISLVTAIAAVLANRPVGQRVAVVVLVAGIAAGLVGGISNIAAIGAL